MTRRQLLLYIAASGAVHFMGNFVIQGKPYQLLLEQTCRSAETAVEGIQVHGRLYSINVFALFLDRNPCFTLCKR